MIKIRKHRKRWLAYFIASSLILFGIYSFTAFHRVTGTISIIPTGVYEMFVFLYCILFLFVEKKGKIHMKGFVIFVAVFLYVTISYVYAVVCSKGHILDYLLIYKSFIYLLFLVLILNRKVFDKEFMIKFINIIFWIFFLKYLASHVFSINPRPIVYVENNFELMFLCVLYLIRYNLTTNKQITYFAFLGCIIFLSFSRSALLMYSLVGLYFIYKTDIKYKVLIFILGGSLLLVLGAYVFLSRSDSIEDIDRVKFALVFLNETEGWSVVDYLVGSPRITPLSQTGCNFFRSWEQLFSHSGDGSCYSVVFHSYILRVIFDHGVLGLISIVYIVYQILKISNIEKKLIWTVIGIFMINGLSVSSFNSVFFPISMIFILGTEFNYSVKIDQTELYLNKS